MYDAILPCSLLAAFGLVILHSLHHVLSGWLKALLVLISIGSIYGQTIMMNSLYLHAPDEEFHERYGDEGVPALFHIHEIYHYYIGAKYFPEVGYKGLYEATALADSESENPVLEDDAWIRSLRDPRWWIKVPEARELGEKEFRANFSDERWEAFKADIDIIKSYCIEGEFLSIINDVGYNPPPTWANIGNPVANHIPISEDEAWFTGLRPYWYQILWLPIIDVVLITAALIFLARSFGLVALSAFIGLYTCSYIAQYNWTSGSLLRWTWLCELIAGACFLRREKWGFAGAFLMLSALDRIFPAAFLVGGGIPLFWRAITKRNWRPFLHFTGAALVTGCIWVGISVAMFGWHAWVEFFDKILLHRSLMFIHCIGYKRLATFDMGLTDPFWESIGGWNGFNELQQETWSHNRWIHYPIMAALVALSAVAALRRPAYEAALLFGGMTVYVTQIATGYYYIYFPLCAVVLLGTAPSRLRDWAIFGVFFVQFMTWFNSVLTGDSVLHHIFICIEIGLFFLFWTCARIWEDWGHLIRRAFTPSVENTTPPPP